MVGWTRVSPAAMKEKRLSLTVSLSPPAASLHVTHCSGKIHFSGSQKEQRHDCRVIEISNIRASEVPLKALRFWYFYVFLFFYPYI